MCQFNKSISILKFHTIRMTNIALIIWSLSVIHHMKHVSITMM